MTLPRYFHALADYHIWATRRLLDDLAPLSDEEWHRDAGLSFFRSMHRAVNHLLLTDGIWWARFAENSSPRIALDAESHTGRADACKALGEGAARWVAWLATLDAGRFDGELAYTRNNGQIIRVPFAPALGHAFNHATHHRGEITAAISAFNRPYPELDWIYKLQQEMPSNKCA